MDLATTTALTRNRLRRITTMGLAEIGYRGRQEGSKWIDRIRRDDRPGPLAVLRRHARSLANPAGAQLLVRDALPQRFFAGAGVESRATLRQYFPDLGDDIVQRANTLLDQRFDLLGYRDLCFGDPVDWHLDPVSRTRAPMLHWSRLDPLAYAQVGDSKVIWELNRHQWIVQLAQAYAWSGDQRYADAAVRAIIQWIAANPAGFGINWASSLEVAMRLISWTWVLALLRHSPAPSASALAAILASLHAHASHIVKYLSIYYSPNTHLTGEALGLFYAGTLLPEFDDARRWRETGGAILVEQADRQITDDGIYFEQSTCYQRYSCDIYTHYLLLAAQNGIDVPAKTRSQVERMAGALAAFCNSDRAMPAIGDADGGWLMPLVARAPDDCTGTLALASALFDRDFGVHSAGPVPELVWLMGPDGVSRFTRATRCAAGHSGSRIFRDGGYALMHAGAAGEAHRLIVDVGPLGCPVSCGHGHADLLSIQADIFGEPCLVDPGTYTYTGEGGTVWRNYFRGTPAHSTIAIDGRSQAEPTGPFRWSGRPAATLLDWQSNPQFDLVDASHDAYGPVSHRRRVLFVKPEFWIVLDDLSGDGEHAVDLTFQFAPLRVDLTGLWARAETPGGRALWVVPMSTTPLHANLTSGSTDPIRGWVSADYGVRMPAPCLSYTAIATLPMRVLTLLYPHRDPGWRPDVEPVVNAAGNPIGVQVRSRRTSVRLDHAHVIVDRD